MLCAHVVVEEVDNEIKSKDASRQEHTAYTPSEYWHTNNTSNKEKNSLAEAIKNQKI